jgi:hypothetical protein
MNPLTPDPPQGNQAMAKNPNEPTSRTADENPYAPPQAPIGGAGPAEVPSDMAEAEAIRRTYLSHEASVKSIGSLHYLGVIFGVLGLAMAVFRALSQNGELGEGVGSAEFVGVAAYLLVMVSINVVMGIGLTGLKPWARWIEVVLVSILLLLYSLGTAGTAALTKGPAVGPAIGAAVVMSLILSYILYLLLSKKSSMVFSPEYQLIIERTPHIKYRTSWIVKGCLIVLVVVIGFGIVAAFLSSRR